MGTTPHLSFCACKTSWLSPLVLVSKGPSPHLWFLHVNQRPLEQNCQSLWVPDLTCRFVHAKQRASHLNYYSLWVPAFICGFWMQNSDFWSRINSLYGSQTSPVVLCMQNSVICSRINSLFWSQPSSMVLCIHNSDFMTRINSLYWSQT